MATNAEVFCCVQFLFHSRTVLPYLLDLGCIVMAQDLSIGILSGKKW